MNKLFLLFLLFSQNIALSQSFAPAVGQIGSTAISKDSSVFIAWATGIEIHRGFKDIAIPTDGFATFGSNSNGLGHAEGNSVDVVSLGDGGSAILTFSAPIKNETGPDFAIFENGFSDNYLELAFVEVSSDGLIFVRFPAVSETPNAAQIGPFEYSDCRYVHNFAGKYRQGFGTPFDLQDLADSSGIDFNAITHIKIIDVVGSINPTYGTFDSQGNIINDLYPTNFESGGFDLDAVGVIHQNLTRINENTLNFSIYPNPVKDFMHIKSDELVSVKIHDVTGRVVIEFDPALNHQIEVLALKNQLLFVTVENVKATITRRILKLD